MKILHFTSDLMASSQVSQAARGRGLGYEMVNRLDRLFEKADAAIALIVIDLQTANWSGEEFARGFSSLPAPLPVIAYAQHVFPELLTSARQVGIPTVLTRGQFTSTIGQTLESLVK
jgi:CheY-like chemotaxis protein